MAEWKEPKTTYTAGDQVLPEIFNILGENEKHLKEISCKVEQKSTSGTVVTINGIVFVEEQVNETLAYKPYIKNSDGTLTELGVVAAQLGTLSVGSSSTPIYLNGGVPAECSMSSTIRSIVYPVGAIYMSVSSTSPASYIGGTWERLKDRFLLGAGSTYTAGNTGGESSHTLSTSEMPSHNHKLLGSTRAKDSYCYSVSDSSACPGALPNNTSSGYGYYNSDYYGDSFIQSTGSGYSHNNMPPYLVVYMWKRTA